MYRSPFNLLQKNASFVWNPQPLRHNVERVFFLMQYPICTVNFTNMSRSDSTWNNLWNLLTINFKYKYFHNFGQGFIFKYISLHDLKRKNDYWKMYLWNSPNPWHDLIINPPCRTNPPPPRPLPMNYPPSAMKNF